MQRTPTKNAIYMVATATGAPMRLNRAMGGADEALNHWPSFSPFVTMAPGGRQSVWSAFSSARDDGNDEAGTQGTGRLQLWVTAIDIAAEGDPSSVPYWLPGQDPHEINLGARWAPLACRRNGETCAGSSAVCGSGTWRPGPAMPERTICQPPPPAECRREGHSCNAGGDCCAGLTCEINVRRGPAPG